MKTLACLPNSQNMQSQKGLPWGMFPTLDNGEKLVFKNLKKWPAVAMKSQKEKQAASPPLPGPKRSHADPGGEKRNQYTFLWASSSHAEPGRETSSQSALSMTQQWPCGPEMQDKKPVCPACERKSSHAGLWNKKPICPSYKPASATRTYPSFTPVTS